MKQTYISEEIGLGTYRQWLDGQKVIINSPTGTGKTTFVLKEFLSFCKIQGKKMLILCNRRLLREQYDFELAEMYVRYAEMTDDVDVMTYQQLANQICAGKEICNFLEKFDVVVCDEVHYFYSDADFNAAGTYVLLQALIQACFFKAMVLITATLEEVKPLLEKTFLQCAEKFRRQKKTFDGFERYVYREQIYDFSRWADYERFKCRYVIDVETLAVQIAKSAKKSVVFIDDKGKAEYFRKLLIKTGAVNDMDIFMLNAQILEERGTDVVIQKLVMIHRVTPKILITTSVLDNGVSIHDPEVGNLVIATESRVSFLQMLGRVRGESVERCDLFIFPRNAKYYEKRVQQYTEKLKQFEQMENVDLLGNLFECLAVGWYGNDERAEFYRNAYALTLREGEYYTEKWKPICVRRGDILLAVNEFAKEKIGNMLIAEKKFWKLALESPEKVAIEQISWLGKSADELEIVSSVHREMRERQLREELLSVHNFTNEELQKKKEFLAKEFRKDLLADIVTKNGSFSLEKLETVCERYGLVLEKKSGEDKKMRYTIREKEMFDA